jgi:Xaa-Pro dipeptidase
VRLSRRQFAQSIAAATGAVACRSPAVPATGGLSAERAPLPPPAALPALPPFDDGAYERRRDHARRLAVEAGANVVFTTSGTPNFVYLAGGDLGHSERLVAFLLPVDGDPVLVTPSFEAERARRTTRVRDVRGWDESGDPYAVVGDALAARRGTPASVLVEPHVEFAVAQALGRAIPAAKLLDGAAAFARLRLAKEDAELARIRAAVAITREVFDAAFAGLAVGVRDRDVSRGIVDAFRQRGVDGYALVQFAATSALPHAVPRGDALPPGCAVLIDGGCSVDGYWSDVTRTRWFGRDAAPEFVRIEGVVRDAQQAAIDAVRPGVAAQELDRIARTRIERAGYGRYFTHRLGHGLGLEGHEAVYLVEGNTEQIDVGQVFTVEPGIYLPERFGVRIEDDIVCTSAGADVLSRTGR